MSWDPYPGAECLHAPWSEDGLEEYYLRQENIDQSGLRWVEVCSHKKAQTVYIHHVDAHKGILLVSEVYKEKDTIKKFWRHLSLETATTMSSTLGGQVRRCISVWDDDAVLRRMGFSDPEGSRQDDLQSKERDGVNPRIRRYRAGIGSYSTVRICTPRYDAIPYNNMKLKNRCQDVRSLAHKASRWVAGSRANLVLLHIRNVEREHRH